MPSLFLTSDALFDSSDVLKLVALAGAAVVLFLIAKRFGRGGESVSPPAPAFKQVAAEPDDEAGTTDPDQPGYVPPVEVDAPEASRPRFQIEQWNFTKFELQTGPPDRRAFADDLQMRLYDPFTGHRWMQTRFVATPAGLKKMLTDNGWNYMFLPNILVLDKFDVAALRAAMLEDIGAVEAARGDVWAEPAEGG